MTVGLTVLINYSYKRISENEQTRTFFFLRGVRSIQKNTVILINILLNNYKENKKEVKIENIDFLLQFNNLQFDTVDFNKFLLNNNNYILFGDRYKGDKMNEEFEGKGEMTYFNGKYDGEWKKGLREGYGIYRYNNGEKYIGMWKNNLEEGNGKYIYKNGDVYDGNFKEGKKEGKGLYTFKNNDKFIQFFGEWKNDKKNGEGIMYYKNGEEIEGLWKNDNLVDKKKVISRYNNNDIYIGQNENNKKNDEDIVKNKNKEVCDGKLKDDKKEGEGIFIIQNNKEDIIGIPEKKDREQFLSDEIKGELLMYYKNCEEPKGIMENIIKEGHGEILYMNEDKYIP